MFWHQDSTWGGVSPKQTWFKMRAENGSIMWNLCLKVAFRNKNMNNYLSMCLFLKVTWPHLQVQDCPGISPSRSAAMFETQRAEKVKPTGTESAAIEEEWELDESSETVIPERHRDEEQNETSRKLWTTAGKTKKSSQTLTSNIHELICECVLRLFEWEHESFCG